MELAKYKIYIAIAITLLMLGLLVSFIVAPTIQNIYSLSDQVKQEKISLATFELKEKNIKLLKNNQTEVDEKLKIMEASLIPPANSLAFILPSENIASQYNIAQSIAILSSTEDDKKSRSKDKASSYSLDKIPYLSVNLRAGGSFNNILTYLLAMEQMGIYTDITTINIIASSSNSNTPTGSDEETQTGDLVATLELRSFTTE